MPTYLIGGLTSGYQMAFQITPLCYVTLWHWTINQGWKNWYLHL